MYTAIYCPLIPLIILLFKIRKFGIGSIFLWLILVPLSTDVLCEIIKGITANCNYLYNGYTLLLGIGMSLLYYKTIQRRSIKILIVCNMVVLFISSLIGCFVTPGYLMYDVVSHLILCVLAMVGSLFYFWELLTDLNVDNILAESNFWINSAILIYFGASISIIAFDEYIVDPDMVLFYMIWPVNLVLTTFYNIILSIGFWNLKKT